MKRMLVWSTMTEPGWKSHVENLKAVIQENDRGGDEDLLEVIAHLEAELAKPVPNRIVVHGILALLDRETGPVIREPLKHLDQALKGDHAV